MLTHVVKRGLSSLQGNWADGDYMAQLTAQAEAYENAAPDMEVTPQEFMPVLITAVVILLILASLEYTIGSVVASLAMVEAPSSTAIVEAKLPPYSDEDLEPLIPSEADVEVTVISHKPITASLCATLKHLRRAGGFFSKWRGLRLNMLYGFLHTMLSGLLVGTVGAVLAVGNVPFLAQIIVPVAASLLLVKVHMLWTHAMVGMPATSGLIARIKAPTNSKALLLPTAVYQLAQQATVLIPLGLAFAMGLTDAELPDKVVKAAQVDDARTLGCLALRVAIVPLSALLLAIFVLLPARATLTRIETALLPAETPALVPTALLASAYTSNKEFFKAAWKSFDKAARLRVIKVYIKLFFFQSIIAFVGMMIMAAEIYFIGGERLALFATSARAQLELALMEQYN